MRAAGLWLCLLLAAPTLAPGNGHAGTAPSIPFTAADVTSPDGHRFTIVWRAPSAVRVAVYAGTDPLHIGTRHKVADAGAAATVAVTELPPAPRWYFALVPNRGAPLVVADRSLHLAGAGNLRDIGGYRTQTGQWVRMGLAYRSNELDHLTADDLNTLTSLHLHLVCDLRTQGERQHAPDRAPAGVSDVSADVLADDAPKLRAIMAAVPARGSPQNPDFTAVAHGIYRDFVEIGSARSAYHLLFQQLADRSRLPMLFHCSAGKDRTGWADAVLLTILGVPHAAIVADYLLTNRYLGSSDLTHLHAQFAPGTAAAWAVTADPGDLQAAFDQVTRAYGSFDRYLAQGLGLSNADLQAIRASFLAG